MREINAWGSACAGAGTVLNNPSTRIRTVSPLRIGSMWISLARSSTAFSTRSLTARTTGAPLARSRRPSMLSSKALEAETVDEAGRSSSDPRRSNSAAAISSKEAIATVTGPPSTISAPFCAAKSVGSATARPKDPPPRQRERSWLHARNAWQTDRQGKGRPRVGPASFEGDGNTLPLGQRIRPRKGRKLPKSIELTNGRPCFSCFRDVNAGDLLKRVVIQMLYKPDDRLDRGTDFVRIVALIFIAISKPFRDIGLARNKRPQRECGLDDLDG